MFVGFSRHQAQPKVPEGAIGEGSRAHEDFGKLELSDLKFRNNKKVKKEMRGG